MGERRPQIEAARGGRLARLAVLAVALTAVLAGCGGGAESSSVAVPEDCLESWNAEQTSANFGRHVYTTHEARQAQIALLEPAEQSLNIDGTETCAVIFAVPESDFEYGDVGLVITKFGWASMQELARGDQIALEEIQREATENPNVNVFPDGTLEPN
jgi:hypothetical protein